jgi:hypothetical protein
VWAGRAAVAREAVSSVPAVQMTPTVEPLTGAEAAEQAAGLEI